MKPELWIVNDAVGKNIARDTRVYVRLRDDAGEVKDEIEISNLVRAADVRMHLGEAVTAKLEIFLTGVETRADVEQILVREFAPRLPWWRKKLRDVSGFTRSGAREYVWR